jgi:hypothetical protein
MFTICHHRNHLFGIQNSANPGPSFETEQTFDNPHKSAILILRRNFQRGNSLSGNFEDRYERRGKEVPLWLASTVMAEGRIVGKIHLAPTPLLNRIM